MGRIMQEAKIRRQKRASEHLVLKAIRGRAMVLALGGEPPRAGHWRRGPLRGLCSQSRRPSAGRGHRPGHSQPPGPQVGRRTAPADAAAPSRMLC